MERLGEGKWDYGMDNVPPLAMGMLYESQKMCYFQTQNFLVSEM